MVSSVIDPSIQYTENKKLNNEDFGYVSSIYITELFDISTKIVLGKQRHEYLAKDVVYYPIYVVSDDKIKAQIGVYEIRLTKSLSVLDEDGDINLNLLEEPLLYSFVNEKYIKKIAGSVEPEKSSDLAEVKKEQNAEKREIPEELPETDETDVLSLKVKKNVVSVEKQLADKILEKGVFTVYKNMPLPPLLKEETQEDADDNKKKYKERANNEWIEKFMKNNHYRVIDNEGGGDCFFAVIRDAFDQIGKKTTVEKLRAIVASQVTDEIYQENKRLYDTFEGNKMDLKKEIQDLKESNQHFKKRMKASIHKEERDRIIEQTKQLTIVFKKKVEELKEIENLQKHYAGFMENVNDINGYREYILTSRYWADAWAISTIEHALNVKIVIMSEEAYANKAYDNVLNCGETNVNIEKKKYFNPDHYIIASYDGTHYKMVTYKNKNILTFAEIPYDIKVLVVNKCLEKNSGIYYLIQDFRNFKSLLGLNPDEGKPVSLDDIDLEDDTLLNTIAHLYNPEIVFVFHKNSLDSKPGKGTSEKIPSGKIHEFISLSRTKNWRKLLDDSWEGAHFKLDGHKWNSIDHYVYACKFKKGYPDFYRQFSLDNPSELSKDALVAKYVADLSNKSHAKMRPANLRVDSDYELGRKEHERENALKAKFTQNLDLMHMLLNTRDALLQRYVRRQPPFVDVALMKLRQELASS
jgi:predicted NAD-dependent protein-ADP-ribosyltransferase YbiA (DUF1768 family)